MDINKRSILWVVFAVTLVYIWNQWMVANGNQSMFAVTPPPAKVVAAAPAAATPGVPGAAAIAGPSAVPGAAAAPAAIKTEVITISTDVFKVDIDTAGGVITRLELLKFADKIDPKKHQVLFDENAKGSYIGQTGLVSNPPGTELPYHRTPFVAKPGARVLDGANEIALQLEAVENGVKLTKTFTFKRGDYVIGLTHEVANVGTAPVSPSLYLQLAHHGNKPEGESYFTSSYTGPTMYTSTNHYEKLQFADIEKADAKHGKVEHTEKANDGWIAISQHDLVSAVIRQ